jgi:methylthioribose-1-phosphate isomerase
MKVAGKNYRTIWLKEDNEEAVSIIDQRMLPHKFVIAHLNTVEEMVTAIRDMQVRGAGLIGAAAGYGMYLGMLEIRAKQLSELFLLEAAQALKESRPTAVNLEWAVDRQLAAIAKGTSVVEKVKIAKDTATSIADEDANCCRDIGTHGRAIIEQIADKKSGQPVNILTHCNAGWLAFVDYGSALASIYEAHDAGTKVHVWVSETRPRNQGASLTAWELLNHGVPHTIIADNAAGHLMQHGLVDMVITGADRVTLTGDVANKIGTYLKALAAHHNHIPFFVALPSSTFDWETRDGVQDIKIEERSGDEIKYIEGLHEEELKRILITPEASNAVNYGFDVTPAYYVTALITERGVCSATEESIHALFEDKKK